MPSVCILSAAWRRLDVTRLVLRQRQLLCAELAASGIRAHSLIVADDENLDIAREYGCETLEAPNKPLGGKCNRGLAEAAKQADYVMWVGSDDWIHPDVFEPIAGPAQLAPAIIAGRSLVVVDLPAGRMQRISSPSSYGAIPWIIDSRLLRTNKAGPNGPIRPDHNNGLDGALIRGLRLARVTYEWMFHDPHEFRCVDFKTRDNITPYPGIAKNLGTGPEEPDPWETLASWYPAECVQHARDLSERT